MNNEAKTAKMVTIAADTFLEGPLPGGPTEKGQKKNYKYVGACTNTRSVLYTGCFHFKDEYFETRKLIFLKKLFYAILEIAKHLFPFIVVVHIGT